MTHIGNYQEFSPNPCCLQLRVEILGLFERHRLILRAVTGGSAPQQAPAPTFQSEEYLLFGNANRGAGEPMIAVDPTNPKNMIAVAMGSIQQLHGKPATQGSTNQYHLVAGSTINWLGVTHDGGVTWDVKEQPILSGKLKRCPDAFADVTKDGVFLAGCEPRETDSVPDFFGMSAFQVSTDKGKTWGPVVPMISDYHLDRFAPHQKPFGRISPGAPDRRTRMAPDRHAPHRDSTGVIYGVRTAAPPRSHACERPSLACLHHGLNVWRQELRHRLLLGFD